MGSSYALAAPFDFSASPNSLESQEAAEADSSVGPGARQRWLEWYQWPRDPRGSESVNALQLKGVPDSAADLDTRCVVVIGLGAVGAIAFAELARVGVGTLIGIDPDHYGAESWVTQPIRRFVDTGRCKADVQGARAHAINPAVHVITANGLAQHVPLWVFRRADLILIAIDNLEVLVWAGTRAAALSKPLIQGAVHGESWLAFVRGFDLTSANHACPGCGLGQREWAMLRSRVGCDPNTLREQGLEPTRTLACVCGAAAHLLVGESLKWLFPIESQRLADEELAYCLLTHKAWRTDYARNPDCPCPHTRWDLVDIATRPDDVTLASLMHQVQGPNLQIRGELPWVSFTVCPNCESYRVPVRRFARPGETVGCCRCGEPLVASPLGIRSVLPREDVQHCRHLPLSQLGLKPGSAVGISAADQWTYFFVGEPQVPVMSGSMVFESKEQPNHDR